ncbi:hypothetical protein [Lactiplantibacillus plantarum]|uniref:hypothetical protein n=1 Tax=Lactiplantibacillus plantarum TaxID=1590 RepID=UPI003965D51E
MQATPYKKNINSMILKRGLKKKYISEQLGIRPETLSRKLKAPESFNAIEMSKLSELLKIGIQELDFGVYFYTKT